MNWRACNSILWKLIFSSRSPPRHVVLNIRVHVMLFFANRSVHQDRAQKFVQNIRVHAMLPITHRSFHQDPPPRNFVWNIRAHVISNFENSHFHEGFPQSVCRENPDRGLAQSLCRANSPGGRSTGTDHHSSHFSFENQSLVEYQIGNVHHWHMMLIAD